MLSLAIRVNEVSYTTPANYWLHQLENEPVEDLSPLFVNKIQRLSDKYTDEICGTNKRTVGW